MGDYYLKAEELCVGYKGKSVVGGIDLAVRRGEIMTLIGPNGAGKSTILKTMSRRLAPVAGTVWLDNSDLAALREHETAKKLALVLTEPLQTELMSCFDVAATGRYPYTGRFGILSESDRAATLRALRRVGAEALADTDFTELSDGQRQRVLLARALCQQPEIIILDEPTSFLDIRNKAELLSLLRRMVREEHIAVLMSLHELDLAERVSDTVVCVNGGAIERCGSSEEIFSSDYISRLYSLERGSFNARFGTLELERPEGAPQAFVIGGNGSGIALYRRLTRENIPFAAGVLHENDIDLAVASPLAATLVTAGAFEPIGERECEAALAIMQSCAMVYCPLHSFGPMNEGNRKLRDAARDMGKLKE